VNPIAGMGGKVGLKGTDGPETLQKAIEMGAKPEAIARTVVALERIIHLRNKIEFIAYPYEMGENEVKACEMKPTVIGSIKQGKTTAADTKRAAKEMMELGVDLILFAGGDGTARDICEVIDQKIPVLGIPTGVKIHSSVFAVNPQRAGDIVAEFIQEKTKLLEAEVMDVNEEAYRENQLSVKLYGYLLIPFKRNYVQSAKSPSSVIQDERYNQEAIAEYIIENMDDTTYYILGPGTTVRTLAEKLGIKKTLLGVDVIHKSRIIGRDVNESELLRIISQKKAKVIVSPIGGQGFIFGRGNQQISPEIIKKIGKENIIVVATSNKLMSIGASRPLLVDTGDSEVDHLLSGYMRVITGYNEEVILNVSN
jgi:predicted polyphosphate/ATP-dependent NAD kinase